MLRKLHTTLLDNMWGEYQRSEQENGKELTAYAEDGIAVVL
jgi:hypothetical protein